MQKRKSPVALRFHKIKQNNDSEMYIYSETMLYYPLQGELTIDQAKKLYDEMYDGRRKVEVVKAQVMEYLESVEEARYHLEMLENDLDLSEVAEFCPRNCAFSITYELSDEIWVPSGICKKLLNIVREITYSLSLMKSVTKFGCTLGIVRNY